MHRYNTRILVNQDGIQLLLEDDDSIEDLMEKYKDCIYIDNVIMDFFHNFVTKSNHDSNSLKIFAQYVYHIVKNFVDNHQGFPCFTVFNSELIFATARSWGYDVTEADINALMEKSGLKQKVILYHDLDVHIELIQRYVNISRLKVCLFCTLFLDSATTIRNSIATFFSGTFYDNEGDAGRIKPVNCESLPPISDSINILALLALLGEFTTKEIRDQDIDNGLILDRCLYFLYHFLKV